MAMNRSVVMVNHGALTLAPRGVDVEMRNGPQDIYPDAEQISSLSLSPPTSKSNNIIPGMQEIFTRFSSPLHPSPILAATLGGYNNQIESYMNEMATTRTTSSCVTTPQSLYSDPINSAEGQSNFENSFEASSSSAIDLVDFPSNLMPNALDEFESLECDSRADQLPDEASQAIEGMQSNNCTLQLDDEEMDIVPNELVQFVSESSRRIQGAVAGGLSSSDSDLDEIDHDAQIASLCLPILHPPSLVSSHMSDSMRPPSLSPQATADGSLVADNSDDLTVIEFTRAYLSEPADSHSTLTDAKDLDGYASVASINDFKSSSDSNMPNCEGGSSGHVQDTLSSPFSQTTPEEITFHQTTFDQLVLKSASDSSATGSYFADQDFTNLSVSCPTAQSPITSSIDTRPMENALGSTQLMHSLQPEQQAVKMCSDVPVMSSNSHGAHAVCVGSSGDSLKKVQMNFTPLGPCVTSSDTSLKQSEVKTTIPIFQNATTSVLNGNLCSFGCELESTTVKVSPSHSNQSPSNKSAVVSSVLLKNNVANNEWTYNHVSDGVLSSSCTTSVIKPEEHKFSQVGTCLVSAPMLCQSAPLINSAQTNANAPVLPPGAVQLVTQTTLSPSVSGTFASPQPSMSLLLTADANKSHSFTPTQNVNRNTLSSLNLPLQILQALPNLRPGMSILLNVKNDKPNNLLGSTASTPLGVHTSPMLTNGTTTPRTDGTAFLLPGSQISMNGVSQVQSPQIIPTQRACQISPNLSQSVLFMPSIPPSSTNSVILSGGLGSVTDTGVSGIPTGPPNASLPTATQFLLLRSPPKPDLKLTGLSQVSGVNSVTSELTFLIATGSSQRTPAKTPSFLLLPTAAPSSVAQQSRLLPTPSNPLNFQPVNSNSAGMLDANGLSTWGYRPTDMQSLMGFTSGSNCLQLGVGQNSASLQNTLLAAALNRSISNNLTTSTLSFPITVLPTNPQTLLMSPSTSVLQQSSNLNTLLSSPLTSSPAPIASQTATVVTTGSSLSSVQLGTNMKFTFATQPGHSSAHLPNTSATSTLSTPGTMIACTPTATNDMSTIGTTSILEPKKLIVLPSADNLLSSSSRASLLPNSTSSNSVTGHQGCKESESTFSRLTSCVHQPLSPCVLSSPTGTIVSSKSASPVSQRSTTSHASSRRRHQCPYCPKSCERKDNLQAHIRTHTGERPYPCRFCPKAFPQKDHLRAHIRTHTGEKPYRCPQCMKAFAQLGNLHRHVKTHKR